MMTMQPRDTASEPFKFCTSLILEESTGLRASTLGMLAKLLRSVPEAAIYHHTHDFLLQHHYLTPEPTNDFAYWVTHVLAEEALGEQLASVDILEHHSLQSLREALAVAVETYLQQTPSARLKFVSPGEEFFFVKSVQVILPTQYVATTLQEFGDILARVSVRCLYYHIFNARLRLGRSTNDFSLWVGEQLGRHELAAHLAHLDPYAHTLDALRSIILSLIHRELEPNARVV